MTINEGGPQGRSPDRREGVLKSNFVEMLEARWAKGNFVCVGLDTELGKIPDTVIKRGKFVPDIIASFNIDIIEATNEYACAFKPNTAFYEAHGADGFRALRQTVRYIKRAYPDIPVILDAKRGDIGNTNNGYAQMAFEQMDADAITVHPYLGAEALKPFLDKRDKGILVLTKTSNPGAGEFQDVELGNGMRMYAYVASQVAYGDWNRNGNCGLVVGATYPAELEKVRSIVGDMPILIPGIGAQGGDLEASVRAGQDSRGWGMIINSSRGIIFASSGEDFAQAAGEEARRLHDSINQIRQAA